MQLERTKLHRYTFLVLFAAALYAFWRTIEPIWVPHFMGLVIAIGAQPLHEKILRKLGGKKPGLAAIIVTLLVMIFVMGIVAFLVFVVGARVVQIAQDI